MALWVEENSMMPVRQTQNPVNTFNNPYTQHNITPLIWRWSDLANRCTVLICKENQFAGKSK